MDISFKARKMDGQRKQEERVGLAVIVLSQTRGLIHREHLEFTVSEIR